MIELHAIGEFSSDSVGTVLVEGLKSRYPNVTLKIKSIERNGNSIRGIEAETDFIQADEMKMFVQGFFTAFNNRERMG